MRTQGDAKGNRAGARLKLSFDALHEGGPPPSANRAPLHLDMAVADFGPIRKASISLRPLTIFIGPSNTGKSYAAMLVHSIVSSCTHAARRPIIPYNPADRAGVSASVRKNMLDALLSFKAEKIHPSPPGIAAAIMHSCRHRLRARLENEIGLNFASALEDLSRRGAGSFSVSLRSGKKQILKYGRGGLAIGSPLKAGIVFQTTRIPDAPYLDVGYSDDRTIHCRVNRDLLSPETGLPAMQRLCELIEEKTVPRMVPNLPAGAFYLPAGRTGILQAHRTISSAIISNAPNGGTAGMQVPSLPGAVSDFVSALIDMQPLRGPYFALGKKIEDEMLGGQIDLKYSRRRSLPELVYRSRDGDVPLHRVSSTISELAPLTLHLKHAVRQGGMLVIEEPEAHLHPLDQMRLAGHMVGLVRHGVNVIITTHSPTLFEALSQYLEVSPMSPRDRRRTVGSDGLYLRAGEVAPHLFVRDGDGGCVAKGIDASAEDGMLQDEFVGVDRLLNETNMRIEEYAD